MIVHGGYHYNPDDLIVVQALRAAALYTANHRHTFPLTGTYSWSGSHTEARCSATWRLAEIDVPTISANEFKRLDTALPCAPSMPRAGWVKLAPHEPVMAGDILTDATVKPFSTHVTVITLGPQFSWVVKGGTTERVAWRLNAPGLKTEPA